MVVADRPLLEVESNPAGSELFLNKFKGTVTHGTGGVFCFGIRRLTGWKSAP